jgi:hypothetical protein
MRTLILVALLVGATPSHAHPASKAWRATSSRPRRFA